jgi:hypothetical protein
MGYQQFQDKWQENARLAWDTIAMKSTDGIALAGMNVMDWGLLEEIGGHAPGSYPKDPARVYLDFQLNAGASYICQWIPDNPLSMTDQGYDSATQRSATTGAEQIVRDGIVIDSPEAVVAHMEKFFFPALMADGARLDARADEHVADTIKREVQVQELFGMNMLKGPYDWWRFQYFPSFHYGQYGYENYFMAYALYPEVMERCFKLQADLGEKITTLAARAIIEGQLPKVVVLDHDMADSRGLLVNVTTLDSLWLPHFARAIKPLVDAGVRPVWHCDGNLMALFPRLLEAGVGGFQGFQYEDGMDYERICRMKDRNGGNLLIWAGVSVTRTLPRGTPDDVKREIKWLVENGPKTGLFMGASSSVAPGTNRQNVKTMIEGFAHLRRHGRKGL